MGLFDRFKLTQRDRQTILKFWGDLIPTTFGNTSLKSIQHGFEENVDVYSVIKKIVDTSKAVPWIVERRKSDGTWEEIRDTSLHELMANPNPTKGLTWDDIEEQIITYLLAAGNSYMIGNTQINRTLIEEVDILPPFGITINTGQDFFLPNLKYQFQFGTTKRDFDKEDIEHIRMFNPGYSSVQDSFLGLSVVQVAKWVVQTGNDRWQASANLFQNRGAIGLLSNRSDRPLTEEEGQKMQQALDRKVGGTHNYGKTVITQANVDFIQMAMTPQDLELIEQGVISLRAICNVLGIDSSLFNDPANKTFNNRKEAEKALYTNAVEPLSIKIAEAHTRYLARNHFPDGNVRMRQDFSNVEVLQEDINEKSKTIVSLRDSGIITANEAREAIQHEPLDDENADKLIVVRNNIPLEDIGNESEEV